jgi:protein-tyrosine phosphatase
LKIGHKPGGRKISFQSLLNDKANTVLSILGEKEGAAFIGDQCKSVGMDWIWLPLSNANIPPDSMTGKITEVFKKIKEQLSQQRKIFIHCSAGLHRTGMITNAFLLYFGHDEETALKILSMLRPLTAHAAGETRLAWGKKFNKAILDS